MRLLKSGSDGDFCITKDLVDNIPPYAILSHTWGPDDTVATYSDLMNSTGKSKTGYDKIRFCGEQAQRDGLEYFWVDTCCIDKRNNNELTEAINSMFRWYQNATKCYVYLSDVSTSQRDNPDGLSRAEWKSQFRKSRWFTRGWTLQELVAPATVVFYSIEHERLGDKKSLEQQIHEITGIPIPALNGFLDSFSISERMAWAKNRQTTKKEDEAYCLLGICGIFMPLIYGEGKENALNRLRRELNPSHNRSAAYTSADTSSENIQEKIVKWLVTTDPSDFHNSTFALREENTGLWLCKSPEYRNWKAGQIPLLWFYGIPGAGKTVLFSYIVEDIKAHCKAAPQGTSVCVYYYCYFGRNQDESSHLLRWVVSQLLRHAQYIPSNVSYAFRSGEQTGLPVLMEALAELSSRFESIYLLIDGLDESAKRNNLLDVLKSLRHSRFNSIKILTMSREELDIQYVMKEIAQEVSLSNPYVDEDIAIYVRSELTGNARLRVFPIQVKKEIEAALVNGARGMFRWAACQMDILSKLHTVADVRRALHGLPKSLDATYEQILSKIPDEHKKRAKQALLLLSGPDAIYLTDPEVLAEAIMVDVENLTYDQEDRLLLPKDFLLELCTCLIRVDESKGSDPELLLAHYTVKEYLYSDRILDSKVNYFHCSSEIAAFTGSVASITYLLNISYADIPSFWEYHSANTTERQDYERAVQESFPFLDNALTLWMRGSETIKDHILRERIDRLLLLLFQPNKPHSRWFEWRVICDIHEYVRPCWEDTTGLEVNVAFSIACFLEQTRVMAMILRDNPSLSRDPKRLILHPAYANSWMDNVREQGISDMMDNTRDYFPGGTPLELALSLGSKECVEVVVKNDPDLCQYINPFGLSALSIAIKSRLMEIDLLNIHIESVRQLLHDGTNVNPHAVSETPLQSAAKILRHDIIAELLEAGALVNEVADDDAVVKRIKLEFEGREEERLEALEFRGLDSRYKTPLRIVLEEIGPDDSCDSADILREHGGLSLCLFPVKDKPGYEPEDWECLARTGWRGVRGGLGTRSKESRSSAQ